MTKDDKIVAGCLAATILALMLVGLASSTVLRHAVQVIAPVIALGAVLRRASWAVYASAPIFLFWLVIMSLIWMYLLGLSTFASGTYSLAERVLTAIIGLSCLGGFVTVVRSRRRVSVLGAIAAFVGFGALQFVAMWASFHPAVSHD